ncbi:related to telomerase reverse transcriptase [Cephalotrichum gorgonifer]|uniref:Telomerase reverse transcriptase n=1 Tax=Cephalotrichum gorgonifer TaxID=2041049 RepID=A0AAE8SU75_9PEZI|nr:related to telomerase reverse transcriptase [Cephalotrichum gorgonifer]
MGGSNDRKRDANWTAKGQAPSKRQRCEANKHNNQARSSVTHSLLAQYYPSVLTLRSYVLSKLPSTSRIRRKKIARIGKDPGPLSEAETQVSHLLDTTLVGVPEKSKDQSGERWKKFESFSQRNDESSVTLSDVFGKATFSQAEIVDFSTWLLFSQDNSKWVRPNHLLCDGFRKTTGPDIQRQDDFLDGRPSIPGLFPIYPNHQAQALKRAPWPQLLVLLGKAGERIMVDLLLDCAVFVVVFAGTGNMWQLSGVPLSDMEPLKIPAPVHQESRVNVGHDTSSGRIQAIRSPTDISFMRNRILYARSALTVKGNIESGLRHVHILNRAPCRQKDAGAKGRPHGDDSIEENTLLVMAYIFPRQFGLHNVFTSSVDRTKTTQKLQDYTLREDEISAKFSKEGGNEARDDKPGLCIRLPKRLRGEAIHLTRRLQILHARCSYFSLLEHNCPNPLKSNSIGLPSSHPGEQRSTPRGLSRSQSATTSNKRGRRRVTNNKKPRQTATLDLTGKSIIDLATPLSQVSRFCQAVLSKIVPNEFWGNGPSQKHNKEVVLRNVDRFIRLRRFENMSLHDAYQGIKISAIDWLAPPNLKGAKMSQSDKAKRAEIFYEFLYYVFDSLLIPLIRCNFYVTDSSKYKYRLLYFRHDIWRCIAEPATTTLKANLLEEVKLKDALLILESRKLGTSHLRLLPKDSTLRPIMNLRRRAVLRGNQKTLGPSINSILGPVYSMLTLEKDRHPESLGSSMFSVGDLYSRLKAFRSKVLPLSGKKLYFAKVDVQAAFDTMPQDAVVRLMEGIPSEAQYLVSKYVEVKPGDSLQRNASDDAIKRPSKRWQSLASAPRDGAGFAQQLEKRLALNKKHTVFVNSGARRGWDTRGLHALLKSHVEQNLIKIGKKYYRQKRGIPQGSVLSSMLCNYLYADLEHRHLSFLEEEDALGGGETLLLRLIDDFLLITTSKPKAVRFVEVMHAGLPDYGVVINPSKSLVNFEVRPAPSLPPLPSCPTGPFPYCGTLIDVATLSLSKDRARNGLRARVTDSLTVETSRRPGQNFTRKTLNAFRLQSHMMFYDTSHNSARISLSNLRDSFSETARKTCAYIRCLPPSKRPRESLVAGTLRTLIDTAYNLLTSPERTARFPGYQCVVSKVQVAVIALGAFREVMRTRGPEHGGVVSWIEGEMARLELEGGFRRRVTALGRRNAEV